MTPYAIEPQSHCTGSFHPGRSLVNCMHDRDNRLPTLTITDHVSGERPVREQISRQDRFAMEASAMKYTR